MATGKQWGLVALALLLSLAIGGLPVFVGVSLLLVAGGAEVRQAWDFLSRLAR